MKKTNLLASAVFIFVLILTAESAGAQVSGESLVTGNGTATSPRRPELLRLRVEVIAEGKTMKEALAQMAERRKSVKQKLSELGAAEQAIEFGDVKESAGQGPESPMQRAMRFGGMRRRPAATAGAKQVAKPVRVAMTVKAQWPLSAAEAEELLLATHDLQAKIRAADVGDAKKLTPEQQEEQEEGVVEMGGEEAPRPGEPVFIFVSKISSEERGKVLASAFAKAKESAQQLAKAAGGEIGALRQLNVTPAPSYNAYGNWQGYPGVYGAMGEMSGNADEGEVVAMTADGMSYRVVVTAAFALK